MKAKYLKESAKEYGKFLLSQMKWFIPVSAGIIALGAIALEPDEEESEEKVPVEEPKEEAPVEEHTNEEPSVEEATDDVQEVSGQKGDENLKEYESTLEEE